MEEDSSESWYRSHTAGILTEIEDLRHGFNKILEGVEVIEERRAEHTRTPRERSK